MEPWSWILVYLVGFTLFQLLLFRYFSDDRSFDGVSLGSGETAGVQTVDRRVPQRDDSQRTETDAEGVRCPHCDTHNEDEQPFRYCRNCLVQFR